MRRELKRWPHLQCGKKVAQVVRQEIHTGMLILFILFILYNISSEFEATNGAPH